MTLRYLPIYLPIFVVLYLGLYVDGVLEKQWLSNLLVFVNFLWVYRRVSHSMKRLMLYGVVIAFGGEVVFSLLLGMYHYRLDNIPIYVPLGHAVLYASVAYMAKEPWLHKHETRILYWLYRIMIGYSFLWLLFANDVLGFLCLLVILLVFHYRPQSKRYFLLMFFMVVYLELLGTYFGCWTWAKVWFDVFTFVPSANPPSAISVFYFAFDAGCLWLYKKRHPIAWKRFRKRRKSLS